MLKFPAYFYNHVIPESEPTKLSHCLFATAAHRTTDISWMVVLTPFISFTLKCSPVPSKWNFYASQKTCAAWYTCSWALRKCASWGWRFVALLRGSHSMKSATKVKHWANRKGTSASSTKQITLIKCNWCRVVFLVYFFTIFHTRVVILCFYSCIAPELFTGPSIHVVSFNGKIWTLSYYYYWYYWLKVKSFP